MPANAKSGGNPPKRKVPKLNTSSSTPTKAKSVTLALGGFTSVQSWNKLARAAPWVSGQSMGISPGDPRAISRLRHSKKFKARKKKVIRPRIQKHRSSGRTDNITD